MGCLASTPAEDAAYIVERFDSNPGVYAKAVVQHCFGREKLEHRQAFVAAGIVPMLVKYLASGDPYAFWVILHLMSYDDTDFSTLAVEAGAVDTVARFLRTGPEEQQWQAVEVLIFLAKCKGRNGAKAKQEMARAGAAEHIRRLEGALGPDARNTWQARGAKNLIDALDALAKAEAGAEAERAKEPLRAARPPTETGASASPEAPASAPWSSPNPDAVDL
jgi:hypothetical protein